MQSAFIILICIFIVYGSFAFGDSFSRKFRKKTFMMLIFWIVVLFLFSLVAFLESYDQIQQFLNQELSEFISLKTGRTLLMISTISMIFGYFSKSILFRKWWLTGALLSILGACASFILSKEILGGGEYLNALVTASILSLYVYWR